MEEKERILQGGDCREAISKFARIYKTSLVVDVIG